MGGEGRLTQEWHLHTGPALERCRTAHSTLIHSGAGCLPRCFLWHAAAASAACMTTDKALAPVQVGHLAESDSDLRGQEASPRQIRL